MKTGFLKFIRKHYAVQHKPSGSVWLLDHKKKVVHTFHDIKDMMEWLISTHRGMSSWIDYLRKKVKRSERVEYYTAVKAGEIHKQFNSKKNGKDC